MNILRLMGYQLIPNILLKLKYGCFSFTKLQGECSSKLFRCFFTRFWAIHRDVCGLKHIRQEFPVYLGEYDNREKTTPINREKFGALLCSLLNFRSHNTGTGCITSPSTLDSQLAIFSTVSLMLQNFPKEKHAAIYRVR